MLFDTYSTKIADVFIFQKEIRQWLKYGKSTIELKIDKCAHLRQVASSEQNLRYVMNFHVGAKGAILDKFKD